MININRYHNKNKRFGAKTPLLFIASCACICILISFQTLASSSGFFAPGKQSSGKGGSVLGGLSPTEDEFDGGTIALGSTGQALTLFRNEGGRPVNIKGIKLYPSSTVSASISLNECSGIPLPGGAECPIVVSIKGLQDGAWRVEMLIQHDGRSQLTKATLKGDVDAGDSTGQNVLSDVESIPDKVDFGSLSSSQPLIKSIILRNVTATPLTIKAVKIKSSSQSGYRLDHDCEELQPSQACLATITWAPQQAGQSDGVIIVEHTGSSKIASIPLMGKFTPDTATVATIFPNVVPGRGLLVSSQEAIDFASGIENEASISVSLVNVGDSDLKLNSLSLSGTDNGMSILGKGCKEGTILRPIEACPLTLRWVPVREGSILDDLQIEHDGARGILVVPVRGNATKGVSKESQAIVEHAGIVQRIYKKTDALAGFIITSHSIKKAIISGPGGSRIIKHNIPVVIGGVEWNITLKRTGIEFKNGTDKVSLLFDRSLSSSGSSSTSSSRSSSTSSSDSQ